MITKIRVLNTNGSYEPLDTNKIVSIVHQSFRGLSINPVELLQKLSIAFYDGITTGEIHKSIIYEAKLFIVPEGAFNNQWALVVGRLEMHALHREIHKNTSLAQDEFSKGYKLLRAMGLYKFKAKPRLLKLADELLNITIDFEQSTQSVVSLKSTYIIHSKEGFIEYPQWANMMDAIILSKGSSKKLKKYYELFSLKESSASTPVKKNLRLGGNTASCFSIMAQDNAISIFDTIKDAALISKAGGGIAVYVGKIRPEGSDIQYVGNAATHINKWVKFFDLVAYTVDQLGSRKGAITVANDWFHLDFLEFLEVATEDGGDIRKKSFDILPQFLINNYLLKQIKTKTDVYLVNNYDCIKQLDIDLTELVGTEWEDAYRIVLDNLDIIAHKKVNAYKLWVSMWDTYFKIGKVNITNKDGINSNNYLKAYYKAQTGNLCLESFSINTPKYDHTCNLMSINLTEIVKYKKSNKRLKYVVRETVDMLNTIIDISSFPTKQTKRSARDLRNTGIGLVGGADYLAYKSMTYDKAGMRELERVQELITYYAYERSIELAQVHGSYPLYHKANYDTMLNHTPEELNKLSLNRLDWVKLNNNIKTKGIRNFLLISPAPNAGTGVVLGASPNFLPVTSLCHFKDMQSMTPIIVPAYADTKFPYYRTRGSFDGVFYLEMSAAIQRWVDTGVSNEIGVNPDLFSMVEFSDRAIDLMLSYETKAIYYMSETACVSCAN